MQGIWLEKGRIGFRDDLPVPQPAAGEALVRVSQAGICGTDINLLRGYYDFVGVPGHEFVGVVVDAPGQPTWTGQRVVGDINISCGHCTQCQAGRPKHCLRRRVLGIAGHYGAFAQYITLPVKNLHAVDDSIHDEMAVFAEPLAAAAQVVEAARPQSGDSILVVGAGRLGQLIARALAAHGHSPLVVARHRSQVELLAAVGIPATGEDEIGVDDYDIVVEASGNPAALPPLLSRVRAAGTLVLKSTYPEPVTFDFSRLVVDEVRLVGSRCGKLPQALDLMQRGRVDPRPMIEARYTLREAVDAFERAQQPGTMKVLFDVARD